ncbi:MAG: amidohydrolase [Allosphingosinicella sp.]|uniref:amidohydrolase n=1 Tax=Allosphingosinicella sp. TaxID=2823234 RepID=UPI003930D97E
MTLDRRQFNTGAAAALALAGLGGKAMAETNAPDLLVVGARVTTLDRENPVAEAVLVRGGRFAAVGPEREVRAAAGPDARIVDAGGRRLIPGLIDSHMHIIRGGLNYDLELRWDGLTSLADGMAMLRAQVARTPPPHWVRVVGGFSEHQFGERRLPGLDELNRIAPDTPVYIMHLYDRALLNRAALRAIGFTRDTRTAPGTHMERDANGDPTGLLIARPNAQILYSTLAMGPRLEPETQKLSTRRFMRELNRLGVTGVIDAGGGNQNYPDDYRIIEELEREDALTVRIAYNLFTQRPGRELEDYQNWARQVRPGQGSDTYRHNGAGEMLVFSAADFEDFREPRPDMPANMEGDLEGVVRFLAEQRWPWRLHATYDETISRALDVFEKVNREVPFDGLHFIIDHAETISDRNIDRVAALGGGIAVQHRMAYQGEYFIQRYGERAAEATPPVAKILRAGVPIAAGTDATRVASYNPWVSLHWLVTGKTFAGTRLYPRANTLDRETALRLWTEKATWFSTEEGKKGQIKVGQLADFLLTSADYLSVPEDEIKHLSSVLTVLGGRVVHAADAFSDLSPPDIPYAADWLPTRHFGGYQDRPEGQASHAPVMPAATRQAGCCESACGVHGHGHARALAAPVRSNDLRAFWGALGCSCFA